MHAEIIVTNPTPDTETSPFKFSYSHDGCPESDMKWSREPINDICTISCSCGLLVSFPQTGDASSTIADVTIDRKSRDLPTGFFTVSPVQNVRIHSGNR